MLVLLPPLIALLPSLSRTVGAPSFDLVGMFATRHTLRTSQNSHRLMRKRGSMDLEIPRQRMIRRRLWSSHCERVEKLGNAHNGRMSLARLQRLHRKEVRRKAPGRKDTLSLM